MAEPSNLQPFLVGTPAGPVGHSPVQGDGNNFMPPRRLLTAAHVARRLAVSERTIRYWVEVGELPGFKIGRGKKLWRFDPQAIEDYLKDKKRAFQPGGESGLRPNETQLSATTANTAPAEYTFQSMRSKSNSRDQRRERVQPSSAAAEGISGRKKGGKARRKNRGPPLAFGPRPDEVRAMKYNHWKLEKKLCPGCRQRSARYLHRGKERG